MSKIPVTISVYKLLNSNKGVISEPDLQYLPEKEILDNLKNQRVTDVHRITITRNNNKMPTKHIILVINFPKLLRSVKGYLKCSIKLYIQTLCAASNANALASQKRIVKEILLMAVAVQ